MDASDQLRRRRSLQERLGLACCGSTWGGGATTMSIQGEEEDDLVDPLTDEIPIPIPVPNLTLQEPNLAPDCVPPSPRMNLAAALEAERNSRSTEPTLAPLTEDNLQIQVMTPVTPTRVSLMRLLEETDDQDEKEGVGRDMVCCVCMGRKKGAAFIPCGHTFCRVCSRELWLNRGSCPLCNRLIMEILDIY